MEFGMMKAAALKFLPLLFMLFTAGCITADNNYLRPVDFVKHLEADGVKVTAVNPLNPLPLQATEALELQVANSNIGVYKFDRNSKSMRARLKRINENKRIYFNGIPYPIYEVHGSFIIVGLDKNVEKHRILKSLRNFR